MDNSTVARFRILYSFEFIIGLDQSLITLTDRASGSKRQIQFYAILFLQNEPSHPCASGSLIRFLRFL